MRHVWRIILSLTLCMHLSLVFKHMGSCAVGITKRKATIDREKMWRTFQFLLLLLLLAGIMVRADAAAYKSVATTDDGPHSCGGVDIPYPFGISDADGNGDFREGFGVACDAGKPVIPVTGGDEMPIPMGNFSIQTAEARVWLPVMWQCYNSSGYRNGSQDYTNIQFNDNGVYRISTASNSFFVLGCNTLGYLNPARPVVADDGDNSSSSSSSSDVYIGCMGYCNGRQSAVDGVCSGVGCCKASIPPDFVGSWVRFEGINGTNNDWTSFSPCDYAFLAEKDYYTFHTADLNMDLHLTPRLMPVTLDWAIRDSPTCNEANKKQDFACKSSHSLCFNATNGPGYICKCRTGYEGNPYILDGCTDINECDRHYPCDGICKNIEGSYECTCPKHSRGTDPFKKCIQDDRGRLATIITVPLVSILVIAIVVLLLRLRREKRKMQDYFEKNGGATLEKLNNIKLYKKEDIRKIQKSCNVIGQGGFGKVYKGRIGNDTELVAVKEPINVNSEHNDQFANEIIIQSRVIHKNIVKLLGCCLEVGFPILVYEFVPKGSLSDILHGDNNMPLGLGQRLQIAAESAEGLAYMHSKTTATILHGDVKPANILINDDYMPKISDFGISRLIATDKKHTGHVIGDMSYLDPVFVQTGLLTKKSDVYSFGVVLLELITRKKASYSNQNELLRNFNEAYKKDKSIIGLVDKELGEIDPQLLDSLTGMINECLSLDVDQRPDMTDIEERLRDMVKRFHGAE